MSPPPKTEQQLPITEPSPFRKFDPRNVTYPGQFYPLLVLFGLNMVDEFDRVAFGVLVPEIRDWFGLSLTALGFITVATAPVSLLLELPIAYMADRKNRVKMAITGASLWAGFSVLTGLAWGLPILIIARIGASLGRLFNATHNSLLSDYYPTAARVRVFYAHQLANRVGQIIAPLAAGALATWFVWRTPFVVLSVPTLLFIFLAFRLREPKRGVHERLEAGSDVETAQIEDDPPGFAETFRVLFQSRTAKRIYYALPFFIVSFYGLATFLSVFYADEFDLNPIQRGVIFASTDVVGMLALFVGGAAVQRFASRSPGLAIKLIGASAIGVSAGYIVLAVSPNLGIAIAGHLLASFMGAMLLPGILAVISFVIPPQMRTLGFATGNLWLFLGFPLIPIVGAFGDNYGVRVGIILSVPIYLFAAFLISTAGWSIEGDIDRVRLAARTQAEMIKSRLEGKAKLLIVRDLDVAYEGGVQVLFGVDFEVSDGEVVALLGTNGAGKSTLLKAISGLLPTSKGAVLFDGRTLTNADPVQIARAGIAQIPGGRAVFPTLTVEENIRVAGWMYRGDDDRVKEATEQILDTFPVLRDRWDTPAGDLSGGEQQMLSLAQAFISRPKLLLIDELTLGLAPTIVEKLLEIVRAINAQGTTIVLVEQSVNIALKLAQRAVFLEKGEVRFSGPTKDLLERPDVLRAVFLKGAAAMNGTTRGAKAAPSADSPASRITDEVVLECVGVTKYYGGILAVDAVDMQLHQGEILGIIGPNGAGKTTFFDVLTGFASIEAGRVLLHGDDVTEQPANIRTKHGLGRSFQDAKLWSSLTVSEAIAVAFERTIMERSAVHAIFGLPVVGEAERDVKRRGEEIIELLGLGAFRDKFVSELSTGSRRIVEIGCVLAHRPSVLLLDEPSSGIAQKETEALGPLLRRVREFMDGSLVVVEHNVPLINDLADRIIAMDLGRVIADGPPSKVLNDRAVVESYLGTAEYKEITRAPAVRKPARRKPARKAKARPRR